MRERIQIDKNTTGHTIIKLPMCIEYTIYIYIHVHNARSVHHLRTHMDTPHLGTHLAHPGVCMPHLHNHGVCCAAELVGWKGRAWSGQDGRWPGLGWC